MNILVGSEEREVVVAGGGNVFILGFEHKEDDDNKKIRIKFTGSDLSSSSSNENLYFNMFLAPLDFQLLTFKQSGTSATSIETSFDGNTCPVYESHVSSIGDLGQS
ncbi:MAG: hypothetical protein MJ223_02650 [Mycoplasmoidaceae bacterium]|nr:hypothetical protein [Mycoplasmoidaceae bacterium]